MPEQDNSFSEKSGPRSAPTRAVSSRDRRGDPRRTDQRGRAGSRDSASDRRRRGGRRTPHGKSRLNTYGRGGRPDRSSGSRGGLGRVALGTVQHHWAKGLPAIAIG